jgi:hypothetical protein
MLILLLLSRDWSAFIFPPSLPSEITETATRGNIFSGKKPCSEGHAYASRRFRNDEKPLELCYLQFHIHCLTVHLRDIVCGSCKHA